MPGQVPTREIYLNLPMWAQVVFYVVSGIASLIFLWGFWRRIKKYRQGRADHRFDRMGRRIKRALGQIFSNSTVRRGDRLGGLAHTLIFWGFLILFIGTCIVALDHDLLVPVFDTQLLQGNFYLGFSFVLDIFGLIFIAGIVMMMVRRRRKLPALDYTRADTRDGKVDRTPYMTDDGIFLWLMLLIAISGYVLEGLRVGQDMPDFERWSPVGYGIGGLVNGTFSREALEDMHLWSWWGHALLVMFFIAYIPFSKMMHIFTDAANLVFADDLAAKRLPALPEGPPRDDGKAPVPAMGYANVTDFTWKELLDLDSCTKCGRCHVACPATAAGTTLSPRDVILDLRTFANQAFNTPECLEQKFESGTEWPVQNGSPTALLEVDVAKNVITDSTLWSCTTCMSCVEQCPVCI